MVQRIVRRGRDGSSMAIDRGRGAVVSPKKPRKTDEGALGQRVAECRQLFRQPLTRQLAPFHRHVSRCNVDVDGGDPGQSEQAISYVRRAAVAFDVPHGKRFQWHRDTLQPKHIALCMHILT